MSNSSSSSFILALRDLDGAIIETLRVSIGGKVYAGYYYFPTALDRAAVEAICSEEGIDITLLGTVNVDRPVE